MKNIILTFCCIPFLTACSGYKTPSISGAPRSMSADTLCYRHATAKADPALADEIAHRRLDCEAILADDPLYNSGRQVSGPSSMGSGGFGF